MVRNETRCVVSDRTGGRNTRVVQETVRRTDQPFGTIHGMSGRGTTVLPFCVKLRRDGVRVEIVQKDLSLKQVLPLLLFDRRRAKSYCWPVLCELSSPVDQIRPHPTLVRGTLSEARGSGQIMLLGVLTDDAVRREKRGQPAHTLPHASNPAAGNSSIIA